MPRRRILFWSRASGFDQTLLRAFTTYGLEFTSAILSIAEEGGFRLERLRMRYPDIALVIVDLSQYEETEQAVITGAILNAGLPVLRLVSLPKKKPGKQPKYEERNALTLPRLTAPRVMTLAVRKMLGLTNSKDDEDFRTLLSPSKKEGVAQAEEELWTEMHPDDGEVEDAASMEQVSWPSPKTAAKKPTKLPPKKKGGSEASLSKTIKISGHVFSVSSHVAMVAEHFLASPEMFLSIRDFASTHLRDDSVYKAIREFGRFLARHPKKVRHKIVSKWGRGYCYTAVRSRSKK